MKIMKQNNQNSGKITYAPVHQDLAVTLMDTPGYFLHLYIYLSLLLSLLRTPSLLVYNSKY